MIRRLLLSSVALAAMSATAFAADLPSRRAPPVYVAPLPVFSWSGGYFGINAGYAFDSNRRYALSGNNGAATARLNSGAVSPFVSTREDGFTGGAQIGYNYELGGAGFPVLGGFGGGGLVIGVEADAAYTDLRKTGVNVGNAGITTAYTGRTDYVGTARGRVGMAFGTLLVYGTGGFAYGGVRDSVNVSGAGGAGLYSGGRDTIKTGYAYGGGIEYAIPTTSFVNFFHSSAVTLKAEFIHYDLGTSALAVVGTGAGNTGGSSYTGRIRTDGNLVRAGLNYKLDFMQATVPVVARY